MTMVLDKASLPDQALARLSPDEEAHIRTYRKFAHRMLCAFCAVPLLLAFALYWST